MNRTDYRQFEQRAVKAQRELQRLSAKANPTNTERDQMIALSGEINALEQVASEMKDAELTELRAMVGRGVTLSGRRDPSAEDFLDFIKTGEIRNASMSTTDGNGGYIVPEPLHAELTEKVRNVDPILRLASHFDLTEGNDTLELPFKATHGVVTNAEETGARSEQNAPTFESGSLTCYDYYTDQRATQTVLDSVPGMEERVLRWVVEDLYEQFGIDLAVGDGNGKAAGLFAATSAYATKLSGAAGALANTSFMQLITALHPRYRPNACFLMNSTTLGVVANFALPNTQVPLVTWDNGQPRIYGYPVYETASAPDIGAANFPVAFGDVTAGYAVGTHRAPGVLRDPFTVTPKVRFYGLARLGGTVYDKQAIVLLRSNNEE